MPDSGSPPAADCQRLEDCPGEESVHAWPGFTPVPGHLLLAPPERLLARGALPLELTSAPEEVFREHRRIWLQHHSGDQTSAPSRSGGSCQRGTRTPLHSSLRLLQRHGCPVPPLPLISYWSGLIRGDCN